MGENDSFQLYISENGEYFEVEFREMHIPSRTVQREKNNADVMALPNVDAYHRSQRDACVYVYIIREARGGFYALDGLDRRRVSRCIASVAYIHTQRQLRIRTLYDFTWKNAS